ncbi:hypothetical protein RF11_03106 [Thelohanellus kitauei]|uniref:Integrase zinc-binding domain-containing protein n=1 Tax=Thelohanellus kitauei TaxID=669202 RepID=A0A0C2MS79_THEKT|nr:hypothetical protein RF11_03106 [Thelohanellus kitauei]
MADALSCLAMMISFTNGSQLIVSQRQDRYILLIVNHLKGIDANLGQLTEYERFIFDCKKRLVLDANVLLFYEQNGKPIVVGKDFRNTLMKSLHIQDCAHNGADKMFKVAGQHFFWPQMKSEIGQFVGKCHIFLSIKATNKTPKAPYTLCLSISP